MPDHSSPGFPDDSPDASPGNPSNGHPASGHPDSEPNSDSNAAPRIAAPEGARAPRGAFSESDETLDEPLEAPAAVVTGEPGEPDFAVIHAPDVEDSYEPYTPLDVDPALDFESNLPDSPGAAPRPDTPQDVELGLMAHLTELRRRLLYCAIILMVGMTLTWNYSKPLQKWFADPIAAVLREKGDKMISVTPTGFFSLTVQFSMISALILTAPLLFWQVWLFIEPALTKAERRYSLIIVPFASALFFTGAGLSYLVAPMFFKFFLAFQPEGVSASWDYFESILLLAKMLLAFGVMFQVPVIVIFLNKLGILSRNVLIEYWRHAVIVIFTVAAIVTPTWDPVTLAVCATPPCLLYILSIWLVKWL